MAKSEEIKGIEITVNLGDFQNIKLQSTTKQEIEYSTEEERVGLVAEMYRKLCLDITSSLRNCLEDLGKESDAPAKFAKACRNRLEGKTVIGQK